jgi:hypothetical protein
MADHKFKLSDELSSDLARVASDLRMEAEQHRDAFDDRSEKWRESEKGSETEAWIDSLDELVDNLDNVDDEPV